MILAPFASHAFSSYPLYKKFGLQPAPAHRLVEVFGYRLVSFEKENRVIDASFNNCSLQIAALDRKIGAVNISREVNIKFGSRLAMVESSPRAAIAKNEKRTMNLLANIREVFLQSESRNVSVNKQDRSIEFNLTRAA